jgi:hypothetical protein
MSIGRENYGFVINIKYGIKSGPISSTVIATDFSVVGMEILSL